MRQARHKAPEATPFADDPTISRSVNREFVLGEGEREQLVEMMRCRVRHFADGAALGTKKFVEAVFQPERHRFGPRRKTGVRAVTGLGGMCALRDLKKDPGQPPSTRSKG